MALVLVSGGTTPMGQFDGLDSTTPNLKGGELVTFGTTLIGSSDVEAADVEDGYVGTTTKSRVVLTTTMSSTTKPLFLADEGTAGYGTLFGQVVGSSAGQSTSGAQLGPHTAAGSGKVTIFGQPGFYATTLDAVDTTAGNGLVPSNATLVPNATITYTGAGLLTPVGSTAAAGNTTVVARLVEFASNGSLVNTPSNLVAALNSPSGSVGSAVATNRFVMAVYWFSGSGA